MAEIMKTVWNITVLVVGTPFYMLGLLAGLTFGALAEGFRDTGKITAWATDSAPARRPDERR